MDNSTLYDKSAVLIVLGSLMKKPSALLDSKYNITENDFVERFHKIVFGAVYNLYYNNIGNITPNEIDRYLTAYPVQKKIFDDNDGLDYCERLQKISPLENFDYYYNILKKYSLLRSLKEQGFNTNIFLNTDIIDPVKCQQMMERFNSLSINDMLNEVEKNLIMVKNQYYYQEENKQQHIGVGLKELKERLKISPEVGLPMFGNIMNTICRGSRRKALYLKSHPSGYFKSRGLVEEACCVAISQYYDTEKRKWIDRGFAQPTLFITTELEIEEIDTMFFANISGVNEEHILDGRYEGDEEERVDKAIEYLEQSELYIVHMPDYTSAEIENTIKEYSVLHNIEYVYFDYIFEAPKLIAEMSSMAGRISIRQDTILSAFAIKLKDLCNELDIHISTATQVSDGWQNSKNPDSSLIKACKSLAEKTDIAYIGLPPSREDLECLQPILAKGTYRTPNMCYHIYKVRRGTWNKIRLYVYFDGSTCRTTELFATNNDLEYLEISGTTIEKIFDSTTIEIEEDTTGAETDVKVETVMAEETNPAVLPWEC